VGTNPPAISNDGWGAAFDANDYLQFDVSTVGYYAIQFKFGANTSHANGPTTLDFRYSTDGSTYTAFPPTLAVSTFWTNYSPINLSTVSTLSNNPDAEFRIYGYGASQANRALRVDDVTISGCALPASINLEKTGVLDTNVVPPNGTANIGDRVNYTMVITNNGGGNLTGITLTDPVAAPLTCVPALAGLTLAPSQSTTCTGSHTLTQADFDLGFVTNLAIADSAETDPVSDSTTQTLTQTPGLSLAKTIATAAAGPWSESVTVTVGADVFYRFVITNTGNVTLTTPTVTDPDVNTGGCAFTSPLAPGATTNCVVGPVAAVIGAHTNTATAHGVFGGTTYDSAADTASYTANKASPTITTVASPSTGTVGVNIPAAGDTATLASGYNPTGSVTFTLYSNDTCTVAAPGMSGSGAIAGGTASWSASWTPTAAGAYYWIASYPGDANNNGFTTSCGDANEQIVIAKASPSLGTTPSPASATVGATLGDTASLTGGYSPTGSVTFRLYPPTDPTCTGPAVHTEVDAAAPYATTTGYATTTTGIWRWGAEYSGDVNNNPASSSCMSEPVTVGKATPTLTTTASGPVTVSANITDTAHLSGGYSPTGTMTFEVFLPGDATCSTPIAVAGGPVSGAGDYISANYTAAVAGDYRWIAHYSGDTNNNGVSTACNDVNETSTVNKATPTLTTTASGPVSVGSPITDTAHLSGGYSPTGTMTFEVFLPGDTTCSVPVAVNPAVIVIGAGDYTSANYIPAAAGDYRWIAHYSGDLNNNSVDTACNDAGETSTVNADLLPIAVNDTNTAV